jgi:hypothetical protein
MLSQLKIIKIKMKTKLALWNTVSREEEHDYNKERRL